MYTAYLRIFSVVALLAGEVFGPANAQELPVQSHAISGVIGNVLYMKSVKRRVDRLSFGGDGADSTLVSLTRRVDGITGTDVWDLLSGIREIGGATVESKESDQRHVEGQIFANIEGGVVRLWSLDGDVRPQQNLDRGTPLILSRDGGAVVSLDSQTGRYFVWDATSGVLYTTYLVSELTASITAVDLSVDKRTVAVGTASGEVIVSSVDARKSRRSVFDRGPIRFLHLVSSSDLIFGTAETIGAATITEKTIDAEWSVKHVNITDVVYSQMAGIVLFICKGAEIWSANFNEQRETHLTNILEGASALDVSKDGQTIAIGGETGLIHLSNSRSVRELVRLAPLDSGWLAVTPDGHFDTNSMSTDEVYWQLKDMVGQKLPLDALARQFHTPQLVPRVLGGEILRIPHLEKIGQRLLSAHIVEVIPDDQLRGTVSITLKIAYADGSIFIPSTERSIDVRLFRDERLVAEWPNPANSTEVVISSDDYDGLLLKFNGIGVPLLTQFGPTNSEFTAFVYNSDGIRGQTSRTKFEIPDTFARGEPTAYIITVGVNAYDDKDLPALSFAVDDALAVGSTFKSLLSQRRSVATGHRIFGHVVWVPLISTTRSVRDHVNNATKRKIVSTLKVLAGDERARKELRDVPGADQLKQARPIDFVLVSFSSHGTIYDGEMYLLAANSSAHDLTHQDGEKGAISGADLYSLMGSIDAGALALIIDACNSAAALGSNGLKYGTIGVRTLGGLAYDKGIAVLAASQPNSPAFEESSFKLGALTFALIRKGLDEGEADFRPRDGQITLSELFEYASSQLPIKFTTWVREARKERLQEITKDKGTANPPLVAGQDQARQIPALLNPQANDYSAIKVCSTSCSCASNAPDLTAQQNEYINGRLELGFSFIAGCHDLGLLPSSSARSNRLLRQ